MLTSHELLEWFTMMMMDGGYMEQEEEWEREGLLDPAWEKQQRKVNGNASFLFCELISSYWSILYLAVAISKC
ncbi:UNVERIFIED_CONTAM: hypothetical protein NCL1_25076 [Trichonephila clavipes]